MKNHNHRLVEKKLIESVREELKKNVDLKYKNVLKRFFKEKVVNYGVKRPIVRKISEKYFEKVKHLDKKEIFSLCEEFLKSGIGEEIGLAFDWAFSLRNQYKKEDFLVFESWLKKYVSNWGSCDHFCTKAFGHFIFQFPEFLPQLKTWTKSKNRWLRRASAVILIYPVLNKKYLKEVFEVADSLLTDKDDMVQKGYGWMLKDASHVYPDEVFEYVMKNKMKMPRTALRYAIERYPASLRKKAIGNL